MKRKHKIKNSRKSRPPFPQLSNPSLIMADKDKEGLVSQFTLISGIDAERAKFYLESAAWSLEVRVKKSALEMREEFLVYFQWKVEFFHGG